jgi:MoaA/NifB/PqqE/SkfB family radical SAM enzyme
MKPFYCMYYVTDWCNAKCSFCNIWENPAYRPSSLERVDRDLSDLKRLGIRYVDFTGGEPFLRRELPAILRLAEEHDLPYGFTTNGSLFERRWPEIRELEPFGPTFSLDGTAEYHNEHRKLKDNFAQIVRSIGLCQSVGWNPAFIFTVTRHTYGMIPDMIDLARDLDALCIMTPVFAYKEVGDDSLSPEQLARMKRLLRNRHVSVDPRYVDFLLDGGNHVSDRTCRSMDTHIVVAPDSSLFMPCYHYSMYHLPTPDGIYAAVASPEWKALAEKAGRYDFCEGCTIYCYMDAGLMLRHPARTVVPLLLHVIKLKRNRRRGVHPATEGRQPTSA